MSPAIMGTSLCPYVLVPSDKQMNETSAVLTVALRERRRRMAFDSLGLRERSWA
jgi:hypothetical protein